MPDAGVAVALLAAGRGERFGGGKLDALCAGKPLGAWAAEALRDAKFAHHIVVAPEDCPAFAKNLEGWNIVTNHAAKEGLAGSVRIAAKAARGFSRLVIALADMPLVDAHHLRTLGMAEGIMFTAYPDGRRGVPAGFPARCFEALANVTGSPARFDWGEEIATLRPSSDHCIMDVDTPVDLAKVEALLAAR